MDSSLSTWKRNLVVDSIQSQDVNTSCLSDVSEATVSTKRLKLVVHPLKMENMVEKILSFLDVKSIKLARQVTKLWSIEGAKILFVKCYITLPKEIWIHQFFSSRYNEEMEDFKSFLSYKSKGRSMIPNITISDVFEVNIWKSLGVLGPQVSSLTLNVVRVEIDWFSNLLGLLPNLNYLIFKELTEDRKMGKERCQMISVLTSIMSKTERVYPLVIPNISLPVEELKDLEKNEKFSACKNIIIEGVKLVVLSAGFKDVPNFEIQIASMISKLLLSHRSTLKSLALQCCEMFLHLMDFPVMTALTEIELDFFSQTSGQYPNNGFPTSFRFSEKVPNLSNFVINHKDTWQWPPDNVFKYLFANTGTSPTVQRLVYVEPFVSFNADPLLHVFPNIQEFQATIPKCSRPMFDSIWRYCKKLKKLQLNIDLDRFFGKVDDLDSIFTGFSRKTVKLLRKSPISGFLMYELEKLRVNPSILDLQGLETLTVRFYGDCSNNLPSRTLAIAGEYALQLMPKDFRAFIHVEDSASEFTSGREALKEVSKLPNVVMKFEEGQW